MPSIINATTSTGLVQTADNSGALQLQTNNGTTAVTVNTSQGVQFLNSISVGNATPTTSGAGITFPATQSASSDANTLDDYEEGTWTPTLVPQTGTITSQTTSGSYVKVGKIVTVTFTAQITGGTISAISQVTGLPFVVSDQNYVTSAAREYYASGNLWAITGQNGGSYLLFDRYDNVRTAANNFAWGATYTYITSN